MPLHRLADWIEQKEMRLFDESGALTPEGKALLDGELRKDSTYEEEHVHKMLMQKFDALGKWLQNLYVYRTMLTASIAEMQDRKRVADNTLESVKSYVKATMRQLGLKKTVGAFPLTRSRTAGQIEVIDKDAVPSEFKRIELKVWAKDCSEEELILLRVLGNHAAISYEEVVSKTEVRRALESGNGVPGVEMLEGDALRFPKPKLMMSSTEFVEIDE